MPIFELDTNLSRSDAGRDVKPELAEKLAELLGVAPENMCVVIRWEADLTFAAHQGGGAKEPCGTARVTRCRKHHVAVIIAAISGWENSSFSA